MAHSGNEGDERLKLNKEVSYLNDNMHVNPTINKAMCLTSADDRKQFTPTNHQVLFVFKWFYLE